MVEEITMKRILVTGGNRGIGKAIVTKLYKEGHALVLHSRSLEQGREAAKEIQVSVSEPSSLPEIECIAGDLSDIAVCYQLADEIKSRFPDLQVLINNAGIWKTEKVLNPDGFELSFMVNYLAPAILCIELKELLLKNGPSRIVNVNAGLYLKGKFDTAKTPFGEDFGAFRTYANTKQAGVFFMLDFAEELAGTDLCINAVHPGVIRTRLGDSKHIMSRFVKIFKRFWKSPDHGADAPVWLATAPEMEGVNGKYFDQKKEMALGKVVLNPQLRQDLGEALNQWLEIRN